MSNSSSRTSLLAAALAAIGASACCAGPLILLSLGISGSWIGNLSAMEPIRPYLIAATLVALGMAFRKLYWVPESCATDAPCATSTTRKNQRRLFWVVSVVALATIAFPWYAVYLFD